MDEPVLDMTPRYAPETVMTLKGERPVLKYIVHPKGKREECPISENMAALEIVTDSGSRWFGVSDAYINAELRMVVVGTNVRDEIRMKWTPVPEKHRLGSSGETGSAVLTL